MNGAYPGPHRPKAFTAPSSKYAQPNTSPRGVVHAVPSPTCCLIPDAQSIHYETPRMAGEMASCRCSVLAAERDRNASSLPHSSLQYSHCHCTSPRHYPSRSISSSASESSVIRPFEGAPGSATSERSIFLLVDIVTSHEDSYRHLLSFRDENAQGLVDLLHLDISLHPSSSTPWRVQVITALLRLSKTSRLLPSSFYLESVKLIDRIVELETPSTDIYRGTYRGKKVFLKRYRICAGSLSRSERQAIVHREAILWASHQQVGILPFIGVFERERNEYESGIYLVSPFLERGTIISYLHSFPASNRSLLVNLSFTSHRIPVANSGGNCAGSQTLDIFSAISYLHSNNIVHGDIKGTNILVTASGHACLADLGYSRLTEAEVLTWPTVQSSASLGTFAWQAPELLAQARAGRRIIPTRAADVYSLGCVLYEVYTDRTPFYDLAPVAHLAYHTIEEVIERNGLPTKPKAHSRAYTRRGLTDNIWDAMEWCWTRDPTMRPSAFELIELACFNSGVDGRPPYRT
ncbi:hypothetical protein NMY22_g5145 [Coprinellus aureogranulatus]|nr:hypothetical protein NMY22_g5145 [Coprinellus aureogranulatus]